MKGKERAFTLIELLIVVSIIVVMSGAVSKLWYGMEKTSKQTTQNVKFILQGQMILDRIERDIERSFGITHSADTLLLLKQQYGNGAVRQVAYRIDSGELSREIQENGESRILKIADLHSHELTITFLNDATVRLEWHREARNHPLQLQMNRLVTFVNIEGRMP
ncbi:MAG: type II secretion system protein [Candidatus Omnitrophota bacterium]|jgi:prepilin-type N-terminal cleavage/methylation domain-containing protein|nr:MAG: type II secretion system protein [Candidatus Omnitrophota bacterium]